MLHLVVNAAHIETSKVPVLHRNMLSHHSVHILKLCFY